MSAREELGLADQEREALVRVQEAFSTAEVETPTRSERKNSFLAEIDAELAENAADEGFRLRPIDWSSVLAGDLPEAEYVLYPYVPRQMVVWSFGPAESAKSLWWAWVATRLTHEDRRVTFVSEENPFATDVDRLARLRPDFSNLGFFNGAGLDLADPTHLLELGRVGAGSDLIVLDTLSACWSGDENDNAAITAFDRERLRPLARRTGATVSVIHHTGHPQAFVNRGGAGAGRGASAMGQKADVVLVFQSTGVHEFSIDHSKNRAPGGHKAAKAAFRIVDAENGGLDIEPVGPAIDPRLSECMDAAVQLVASSPGTLGTNALKGALKEMGFGGGTATDALRDLKAEDPTRVRQVDGTVIGGDGKRRKGRPWVAVETGR